MKNKNLILSLISIFVPIILLSANYQAQTKVDKSAIVVQLKNGTYTALNSKLEEYNNLFESDYLFEENLMDAYSSFQMLDYVGQNSFFEWIKSFPVHYIPYVARAKYYCGCAVKSRGNKINVETYDKEYQEMQKYYLLALSDLDVALNLKSKNIVCYAMQVEIGKALENDSLVTKAFNDVQNHYPYSYMFRLAYLNSITPSKGGSYQEMAEHISDAQQYVAKNPKLKELNAVIPAEKARLFCAIGKYSDALKMYDYALSYSQNHSLYAKRGYVYAQLRDTKNAEKDFNKAIELSPNNPEYLRDKQIALKISTSPIQKNILEAQSTSLDPFDDWPGTKPKDQKKEDVKKFEKRGYEFMRYNQYENAIQEFDKVLAIDEKNYKCLYYRGLCNLNLNRLDASLQDLNKAIKINPEEIEPYIKITFIYSSKGSYNEALVTANKAISIDSFNPEIYYYRAKINERLGNIQGATEDIKKSCDLGYQRACYETRQVK